MDIAIDHPDLLYTFLYLPYLSSISVLMSFCQVTLVRKAHTSPRNLTVFPCEGVGSGDETISKFLANKITLSCNVWSSKRGVRQY